MCSIVCTEDYQKKKWKFPHYKVLNMIAHKEQLAYFEYLQRKYQKPYCLSHMFSLSLFLSLSLSLPVCVCLAYYTYIYIYIYIQGSLNKFPDFFSYGHFYW